MSDERRGIFSESHGKLNDMLQNATGFDHVDDVKEGTRETVTRSGVMMLSDCNYCGLQWRGVVKWPEIAGFFTGQQVPGTRATQEGVASAFGCRKCSNVNKFILPWEDVDRYVARGVNMGALPKNIYQVREQVMRQRAAAAAAQRR